MIEKPTQSIKSKIVFNSEPTQQELLQQKIKLDQLKIFEENQVVFKPTIDEEDIETITPLPPRRHWSIAAKGLLLVLATLFTAESAQFLSNQWMTEPLMASLYSAALLLAGGMGLKGIVSELGHLRQLKKRQEWYNTGCTVTQGQSDQALKLCREMSRSLPTDNDITESVAQWKASINDHSSDYEIMTLFSDTVLKTVDDKAMSVVNRYARETALMIAVSPMAVLDVAIVLWRSVRMMNEISALYGIKLGYVSRIRLMRTIAANIIYAGTTELIADLATTAFSLEITGKLSIYAAQGLGAGLLTGRLGLKTIQYCRAIPAQPNRQQRLGNLAKAILKDITHAVAKR